ncbi:NADPH-dependent ferric siderophore reductase [Leucobacter luti]|uniref:NADPH-dependent ferric siderophore reductase n=1 Tax=Leucobacter luti TaxID=340320 RepID=A0A4R6RTE0_9MICO|nr:siderophore-interacting protein [Leucobacter luti]TDP90163.1 NADPH-dependent ferric siderophore reductase [Leucobacter luti]
MSLSEQSLSKRVPSRRAARTHRSGFPHRPVRASVESITRVSPTFARVVFVGPELDECGDPGATFDQRIKLIFPAERLAADGSSVAERGELPVLSHSADWYAEWLALPESTRGAMRTYSIRELQVSPSGETRFIVDFVLHLEPGKSGPAARWAGTAQPGDELLIVAPVRGHADSAGIEFRPGDAPEVVLVGDETAAPAIARILEDLPVTARGIAWIEIPDRADELPIAAPADCEVRWVVRGHEDHGTALIPELLAYLGERTALKIEDVATEQLLWETPVYSGLGEDVAAASGAAGTAEHAAGDQRYFWIAGESGVVTTLRRHLVRELGISRSQVAFMGYWRRGVAMKG